MYYRNNNPIWKKDEMEGLAEHPIDCPLQVYNFTAYQPDHKVT